MVPPYFLTTDRLGLRVWQQADIGFAVALWGDPAVAQFLHADGPPSHQAIAERLVREMATQELHGFQYWPVFLLDDGAHVGCCGLRPYCSEVAVHEFGTHLRPTFWRQGLAHEAGVAVRDYARHQLHARGLFAGHHPENAASGAMLRKLGFRYTHDELYAPTGLHHPSYLLTFATEARLQPSAVRRLR
jgi:RimJ/RimL family protein N-acetyltransferase